MLHPRYHSQLQAQRALFRSLQPLVQHKKEKKRRSRTPWLDSEIQNLIIGVYNYGIGKWALIKSHLEFQSNRTYIDLKDKWRNLVDHRNCARTALLYRAVSAVILRMYTIPGLAKPVKTLGSNDWTLLLTILASDIEKEIRNLSESAAPSPPEMVDIKNQQIMAPQPNIQHIPNIPPNYYQNKAFAPILQMVPFNVNQDAQVPKIDSSLNETPTIQPNSPVDFPQFLNVPCKKKHEISQPVRISDIIW